MLLTSLLLNGLVLGSILLLVSLGLTLIYGVGRIVNFAHGVLYSLGGMLGVWASSAGLPFWAVLLAVPLAVGGLGILIDWAIIARIRERPMMDSLLLTFGLAMMVTGVLYEFGGRTIQALAVPPALRDTVTILGSTVPSYRVFVTVFAVLLVAGLFVVLRRTRWGLSIQAVNDDGEMAGCLGLDREVLMHSVVGVGAALAALAGVVAAPIFTAYATAGDKVVILAFLTVILGGLGSLRGAIAAAYIVAITIVIGEGYFGGQVSLMALFVVVMAVLSFMPRGIFGEGRVE